MNNELANHLLSLRIDKSQWRLSDLRINIPPLSYGSDAINAHTQYSNPIAIASFGNTIGCGASFTLGHGNDLICRGVNIILEQINGSTLYDLINSPAGLYEILTNPAQLRWLSPFCGLPLMSAGLIVNTLIDAASKRAGLPAWEFLAYLPSEILISLFNLRHLGNSRVQAEIFALLEQGLDASAKRSLEIKKEGLPVYFTTWIGHSSGTIIDQIREQHSTRGIGMFKIKISPDIDVDFHRLRVIRDALPDSISLCVDANQTLDYPTAEKWLSLLSTINIQWLEEPFAPDNTHLFARLIDYKRNAFLSCEVVTGENCPNYHTASSLMDSGIDRFQADPCRMLGIVDAMLVCIIAKLKECTITPHAGGSALDELSPHIQAFNLARIDISRPIDQSLTENVGFCSKFFDPPTVVKDGNALAPSNPGLLGGLQTSIQDNLVDYTDGTSWLEL